MTATSAHRYLYRETHEGLYLPTTISSVEVALLRNFLQMSMVKRVLALLKMESRSLISAAIITAIIRPRAPESVRTLEWCMQSHTHLAGLPAEVVVVVVVVVVGRFYIFLFSALQPTHCACV